MRRSFARDLPMHPVLRLFLLTFDPLRYVRDAQSDFAVRVTIGDSIENCGLYWEARRCAYDVAFILQIVVYFVFARR